MHSLSRLVLATVFALGACGGKQSAPPATTTQEPATTEPAPATGTAMTAEQCTAAGGEVVGDIGDGAIHRPEYRCAKSGEPPLGPIQAEAGKPVAIEGAVCCK